MASTSLPQPAEVAAKPERRELRKFLSAPGILFLVLVTQVPFVLAIYFSFTGWNLLRPTSKGFLGWDKMWRNFSRILTNADFYSVLWITLVITVSVVVITFVLGLMFALLLNRPFPGRALAQNAPHLPLFDDAGGGGGAVEKRAARPVVRSCSLIFFGCSACATFMRSRVLPALDRHRHHVVAVDSLRDADFAGRFAVFAGLYT